MIVEFLAPPSRGVDRPDHRRAHGRPDRGGLRPRDPHLAPPDSSLIVRQLAVAPYAVLRAGLSRDPRRAASLDDLAQHNCLRYPLYPFGDEWRFIGPGGECRSRCRATWSPTMRRAARPGAGRPGHRSWRRPSSSPRSRGRHAGPPAARPSAVEFAINAIYPTATTSRARSAPSSTWRPSTSPATAPSSIRTDAPPAQEN